MFKKILILGALILSTNAQGAIIFMNQASCAEQFNSETIKLPSGPFQVASFRKMKLQEKINVLEELSALAEMEATNESIVTGKLTPTIVFLRANMLKFSIGIDRNTQLDGRVQIESQKIENDGKDNNGIYFYRRIVEGEKYSKYLVLKVLKETGISVTDSDLQQILDLESGKTNLSELSERRQREIFTARQFIKRLLKRVTDMHISSLPSFKGPTMYGFDEVKDTLKVNANAAPEDYNFYGFEMKRIWPTEKPENLSNSKALLSNNKIDTLVYYKDGADRSLLFKMANATLDILLSGYVPQDLQFLINLKTKEARFFDGEGYLSKMKDQSEFGNQAAYLLYNYLQGIIDRSPVIARNYFIEYLRAVKQSVALDRRPGARQDFFHAFTPEAKADVSPKAFRSLLIELGFTIPENQSVEEFVFSLYNTLRS